MERRINNILLGYTLDDEPFFVRDLGIGGAIAVLLKDAINPNIVQTTENTPAIIHGGPFANIAHGCNSIIATKTAMSHSDYVITEAGFGADLGAEKLFNIKCRKAGIAPSLTVIVATLQGLKMHGGVDEEHIKLPSIEGIQKGFANLDKHIRNMQHFGQSVVVCFNRYAHDTDKEIEVVRNHCNEIGVPFALNNAFTEGGKGAVEFAQLVAETIDSNPSSPLQFTYDDTDSIDNKIEAVAQKIYGAKSVTFSSKALREIKRAEKEGFGKFPVCIAKTHYSFSQDSKAFGVPHDFNIDIRNIIINAGAEVIVAIAGDIIRMPGLPKSPQALRIDIVNGEIDGLS